MVRGSGQCQAPAVAPSRIAADAPRLGELARAVARRHRRRGAAAGPGPCAPRLDPLGAGERAAGARLQPEPVERARSQRVGDPRRAGRRGCVISPALNARASAPLQLALGDAPCRARRGHPDPRAAPRRLGADIGQHGSRRRARARAGSARRAASLARRDRMQVADPAVLVSGLVGRRALIAPGPHAASSAGAVAVCEHSTRQRRSSGGRRVSARPRTNARARP